MKGLLTVYPNRNGCPGRHSWWPFLPQINGHWRKIKGQHDYGQQDREPLRGKSASERTSEREGFGGLQRFLEVFRGLQRFLEVFRGFSEVLSETLSEADFPLRGSRSRCPYSCCPLVFLQGYLEKSRGATRLGATGPRASEREICL